MPADSDDQATPAPPPADPADSADPAAEPNAIAYVDPTAATPKPVKEGELLDADGRPVDGEVDRAPLPEFEGRMGDIAGVLSESSLGRGILRGGQWIWDHSTFVVFLLLAFAVATWALRLRQRSDFEADNAARNGLYSLENIVREMEVLRQRVNPLGGMAVGADEVEDAVARGRESLSNVSAVTRGADDPIVARSLRLQGDFYWLLATLPPVAGPSTRPAEERPDLPDAAGNLAEAKAMYGRVVSEFGAQANEARIARFGLAAVAEEQGDFPAAREQYDALLARETLPAIQRDYAETRRRLLDEMSPQSRLVQGDATPASDSMDDLNRDLTDLARDAFEGIDLGELNAPPAVPATQPSTPATQPSTQPATGG